MSAEKNVQAVKDFFDAIGRGDKEDLLAVVTNDIEWIIPGEDWPLAGTYRGPTEFAEAFERAGKEIPFSYPEPPEYISQGDKVLVIGFAKGKVTATNKTFEDHFIFAITMRDGKLAKIREYIDTQALARAAQRDASTPA